MKNGQFARMASYSDGIGYLIGILCLGQPELAG